MKIITSLFLILLFSIAISLSGKAMFAAKAVNGKYDDTARPVNSIALLGVYHFENPNLDAFNVKSDNVLSPNRQKEIQELVEGLSKYKPTHIALEFDASKTDADEKYQRYLKGEYVLGPGEGEQIGFRLAKLLGHAHIYPADVRNINVDFDPGELANEFGPLLQQLGKEGNKVVTQINNWVKNNSIGGVLAKMNTPEADLLNIDLYYKYLLPVGKGDKYPGGEAVTRWYKRNLFIFHNIMRILNVGKENRVLVIFGQGHTAMLNQFLRYSALFKKEDIRKYLPAR